MKKAILFGLFAIFAGAANASDGTYWETETFTTNETFHIDTVTYYDDAYVAPRRVALPRADTPKTCDRVASSIDVRPCAARAGKPVRVKTFTEVIDHYQVYQPVTVYQPVGTYSTRRVIEAAHPTCNKCRG